jgi:hypothetical protein
MVRKLTKVRLVSSLPADSGFFRICPDQSESAPRDRDTSGI